MDQDNPHPEWHGDEFHGVGGQYIYDAQTKKRTRVEPEQPAPAPVDAKPTE